MKLRGTEEKKKVRTAHIDRSLLYTTDSNYLVSIEKNRLEGDKLFPKYF